MKRKLTQIIAATLFIITGLNAQSSPVANSNATSEKKLKISTRIQARAVAGQLYSDFASSNDWDAVDFNFRRIRLTLDYTGKSWYGSKVDIKGENLLTEGTNSKSSIQEANIWFKPGLLGSKIFIGQFKLPFIRENFGSSSRLMVTERATASSSTVLQQQDIGILLHLRPIGKLLDVFLSVTNGEGSGHDGVGAKKVQTDNAGEPVAGLYNWRIQFNPFGGVVKDGKDTGWSDGKEIFQSNTLLSIGIAGVHTTANESPNATTATKFLFDKELHGYTADFTLFLSGFYLNGEYTIFTGDSATKDYSTYSATAGYNVKLGNAYLMPVIRYNYVQADWDRNQTLADDEKETDIWAGVNFYLDKNSMKMQLFYRLRQDATGSTLQKDELYFQVQANL